MNTPNVDWSSIRQTAPVSSEPLLIPIKRRDGTVEFYEEGECVAALVPAGVYLDEVMKEFYPDHVPQSVEEVKEKQCLVDDEGNHYPF